MEVFLQVQPHPTWRPKWPESEAQQVSSTLGFDGFYRVFFSVAFLRDGNLAAILSKVVVLRSFVGMG